MPFIHDAGRVWYGILITTTVIMSVPYHYKYSVSGDTRESVLQSLEDPTERRRDIRGFRSNGNKYENNAYLCVVQIRGLNDKKHSSTFSLVMRLLHRVLNRHVRF